MPSQASRAKKIKNQYSRNQRSIQRKNEYQEMLEEKIQILEKEKQQLISKTKMQEERNKKLQEQQQQAYTQEHLVEVAKLFQKNQNIQSLVDHHKRMLKNKQEKDKKDKALKIILQVQLNNLQKFLLLSVSTEKGLFQNKDMEKVLQGNQYRQRKLSKYQLELAKWKGEIDEFDEINIELNLNLDEYLHLKKFKKPIYSVYQNFSSLIRELLQIKKEFREGQKIVQQWRFNAFVNIFKDYPERVPKYYAFMQSQPKNVVFELFNIKRIKKDSQDKVINTQDLEDGLSDFEEDQQNSETKMSIFETQSNFSFFNSLVDKALEGEFCDTGSFRNFKAEDTFVQKGEIKPTESAYKLNLTFNQE